VNDPVVQTYIVAIAIHIAATAIAFYLWTENRNERFLQFWTMAWAAGLLRWLLHYPGEFWPFVRAVEGILISGTMFFMVLGSWDLLPGKPWRQRSVVITTAAILVAYGVLANAMGRPLVMGYVLYATVLAFVAGCMLVAYRSTRLAGHVFAAATCLYQLVVVSALLVAHGRAVADNIILPLYNIPLMLSIVVIAHQREKRKLVESERTLQKIFVRLANVEDDERRALHAELHDQVGANLSALRLELDVAANLLSRGDDASAERHLGSAREVAAETIVMARNLMAELRPPALDDYGLVAALRAFAEAHSTRLDLPIQVTGEDLTPRPSHLAESALFRIAHEAVINAARHAAATCVVVEVRQRDGRVVMTVRDDGIGFNVNAPGTRPDHWGLKSMRERALAIGGVLRVEAAAGAGTRVTADVPGQAQ
jgi:signal transduction histidine kinase